MGQVNVSASLEINKRRGSSGEGQWVLHTSPGGAPSIKADASSMVEAMLLEVK